MHNPLITALQNPDLYDHPVRGFKVLETHISWVILTGEYAYKIKKPVDFEFLDFSTLEKRQYYCQQELLLNQALASEIYEKVVPIYGTKEAPTFNPIGEVVEYALKMREFPQEMLFNRLLKQKALTAGLIEATARIMADFHANASQVPPDQRLGTPEQVHEPVRQNFDQIRPFLKTPEDIVQLDQVEKWANDQHRAIYEDLQLRKDKGFIRACHGDVHLGNIVLLNEKPVIFDCIDFNVEFRWTDTMADVGFLAMDLDDHHCREYSHLWINAYFESSGDYHGLAVLRYYQSYRSVVRAKVALFQLCQPNLSDAQKEGIMDQYRRHMRLAQRYIKFTRPMLVITHGVTGSGKSTMAKTLVRMKGAIRIRSDLERKRLAGMSALERSNSQLNQGLYSQEATQRTYDRLAAIAKMIIEKGYTVVVDAAFLTVEQRSQFENLANTLRVPFKIIACYAPDSALKEHIQKRQRHQQDPSEATLEVLAMQQKNLEPLTPEEEKCLMEM